MTTEMTECPDCEGEGEAEGKCDNCYGYGGEHCPKCGSCGIIVRRCAECKGEGEIDAEE